MKIFRKKDKQRISMLGGAVLLLAIMIYLVLQSQKQIVPGRTETQAQPVTQNPKTASITLVQQGQNTVDVVVDAGVGKISAVQLALSYDPQVLTDVQIQKGTYFPSPFELLNMVDGTKGNITYAIGISPKGNPQTGKGTVAVITYTPVQGVTNQTQINFLPQTKVTAEGVDTSVLQHPSGISINL